MSVFPLFTERLTLRPFTRADLAAFTSYRRHPEVALYQSWSTWTDDDAEAFLRDQHRLTFDSDDTWFQIAAERRQDGQLIGDVAVHFVDGGRQAELGVTFDVAAQHEGYAGEAMARVIALLFDGLRKHRITATVDALNRPAQRLLERLGFRREAHHRENIFFKGRWSDEFVYALLQRDWETGRDGASRHRSAGAV